MDLPAELDGNKASAAPTRVPRVGHRALYPARAIPKRPRAPVNRYHSSPRTRNFAPIPRHLCSVIKTARWLQPRPFGSFTPPPLACATLLVCCQTSPQMYIYVYIDNLKRNRGRNCVGVAAGALACATLLVCFQTSPQMYIYVYIDNLKRNRGRNRVGVAAGAGARGKKNGMRLVHRLAAGQPGRPLHHARSRLRGALLPGPLHSCERVEKNSIADHRPSRADLGIPFPGALGRVVERSLALFF